MAPTTVTVTTCTKHHNIALSPTFYPSLYDSLLKDQDSYYSKWKTSRVPWQLRLVGGPGSGKTSFATLAVRDLGKVVESEPGSIVLSAFFTAITGTNSSTPTSSVNENASIETAFLAEIGNQLSAAQLDTRRARSCQPLRRPKRDAPCITIVDKRHGRQDPLPSRIEAELSGFSRVYLVVDDLDAAWLDPEAYLTIEEMLSWLESLDVRILGTSRTYYRKNKLYGTCDIVLKDDEEDKTELHCGHRDFCLDNPYKDHVTWWVCVACSREKDDPTQYGVVCEACRQRGYGCAVAGHASSLLSYESRIVYMDMENLFDDELLDLIEHLLQSEHGRLFSDAQAAPDGDTPSSPLSTLLPTPPITPDETDKQIQDHSPYPPLSQLGHQLSPSSACPSSFSSSSSRLAARLRNLIYHQSNGHLLNALCRIENLHQLVDSSNVTNSLEAALELEVSDRLPASIVAVYNDLVHTYIEAPLKNHDGSVGRREGKMRAAMVLHAIRLVGKLDDLLPGVRFSELRRDLLREDVTCQHGFVDVLGADDEDMVQTDVLEQVVGTASGLLTVGRLNEEDDPVISFFHYDFFLYVTEEYNTFLADGKCC